MRVLYWNLPKCLLKEHVKLLSLEMGCSSGINFYADDLTLALSYKERGLLLKALFK
jgi:hypothetical protein